VGTYPIDYLWYALVLYTWYGGDGPHLSSCGCEQARWVNPLAVFATTGWGVPLSPLGGSAALRCAVV